MVPDNTGLYRSLYSKDYTVVTLGLLHFAIFCQILEKNTPKYTTKLLNPEILPDCYTFLTFFCNSPGIPTVYRPYILYVPNKYIFPSMTAEENNARLISSEGIVCFHRVCCFRLTL